MEKEFIDSLRGLLSIPSVAIDGDEKYPFGESCSRALDYMLNLCDSFGFRTKRCSNLLGYAEIGEGDELVGILAHLDVVPEGTGWDYPAFGLTEVDDKIYGRGISDDKGPAMMCVYAMKKLLDSGKKLDRRVRIIFGLTEERGERSEPRLIPFYTSPAAAGYAAPVPDEDFTYIPADESVPRGADFAVRIQGDSMEPEIADGSTVYVNRDPLTDGDVGIFCVDGAMLCKQYHRDAMGVVYLFSLNRARADADVVLTPSGGRGFACVGRVMLPHRVPVVGR